MTKKQTLSLLGCLVLVLLLALSVVFLLASTPPEDYRPFELRKEERNQIARHSLPQHLMTFVNGFNQEGNFKLEVEEDDMNMYLASLEEIASYRPDGAKHGGAYAAMDEAGLAGPFVKFNEGYLTCMFRLKKANKIISVDLAFESDGDGKMTVQRRGVRVGKMPVPDMIVDMYMDDLKDQLSGVMDKQQVDSTVNLLSNGMDLLLAKIIIGMDGEPFPTDLTLDKQTKHTHRVDLADGKLTLHIAPSLED